MTVKLNLDRDAVVRVPMELVIPRVRKLGNEVLRGARSRVRVKTGAVKGGIVSSTKVTRTKYVVTITAKHKRSLLEHDGARKHRIVPVRARALRFFWARVGHTVVLKSVNHPGTEGSQFLTRPLLERGLKNGFLVTIRISR